MSGIFGKGKTCHSAAAPDKTPAECNLVLLGVMGCGKSALTVKFLTKRFISEYDPHLEDVYSSEEKVDQQLVTVRVMDTCDQCVFLVSVCVQEGPVNSERYLSWASAFLVIYSIVNMESFKGCQLYLQTLALHNKTFNPQTPIILLGNKLDMDRYRLHVFYQAVRSARRRGERGCLVPAIYVSEEKALLGVPSFTTPCYKELPTPATAKLVTVKTSRAQSKRRAATLTLLKGFKIF
ncbi:ras-like protein family member 12 isoform X3 [Pseudoliparis swirei]|uniref:ras-like protein family member 12 isoform X3 n=1 Tax=Pseudoliparis swirei TaxID=2059687 RepID=UPI0024BDBC28|nr:ras-like protein family member 12 isoform X3 [Pseudoliparis swirei]